MEGHTDKWCIANCDPRLFPELDNVSVTKSIHVRMHTTYYCAYNVTTLEECIILCISG